MNLKLEKIVDFIQTYSPQYKNADRKQIGEYITLHFQYKTGFVVYDGDKIVALARWNILPNGTTAEILDLIIHPDYRKYNRKLMQNMMLRGHWIFPKVEYFCFERYSKYPKRVRLYSIRKFLKGE